MVKGMIAKIAHAAYHRPGETVEKGGTMMGLRLAALALLIGLGFGIAEAFAAEAFEHGGGCRKDSPPGRCCHMDRSVGIVHCH